jgi:DNA-binding FadR family transcriptional regulator
MTQKTVEWTPIGRRELIHEAVQIALKDHIIERDLRPGDPLPAEGDLAKALGVSRNSVREAVKALEGLGVLESRTGSGLFVKQFSLDAVLNHLAFGMLSDLGALADILDVRLLLEAGMVERIVASVDEKQVSTLAAILKHWRTGARRGRYLSGDDRAFHEALYANCANIIASQILDAFWRVYHQARTRSVVPEPADPLQTYRWHQAIFEALVSQDVSAMRQAVAGHHEGILRRVESALADVEPDRRPNAAGSRAKTAGWEGAELGGMNEADEHELSPVD